MHCLFSARNPNFSFLIPSNGIVDMSGCILERSSREEAAWTSGEKSDGGGGSGHRPTVKGGYFPVPPVDSLHDIRSAMVLTLESIGVPVEVHHHEVATAGQCEIGTLFSTLVKRADWTQMLKYVVHNVAHQYGKSATFMPKPHRWRQRFGHARAPVDLERWQESVCR